MAVKYKWQVTFLIALFLTFFIFNVSAYAAKEAVVSSPVLNVRAGPDTNSGVVQKLQQGDKMTVLAEQNDWLKVQLSGGGTGWVAAWLVKVTEIPDKPVEKPVTVRLAEKTADFDVAPYIDRNDRTMVPIRFVVESFGGQVQWVEDEAKVVLQDGKSSIELWVGKRTALVNGQEVQLDTEAVLKNGRTMLPLRFISESMGAMVVWRQDIATVDIYPAAVPIQLRVKVSAEMLNVRSGPGAAFEQIAQVPADTLLPVFNQSGFWYQVVLADSQQGWVATGLVEALAEDTASRQSSNGVTSGEAVNVRTGPRTSFPVIYKLNKGEAVEMLALAGDWTQVRLGNGQEGWVSSRYILQREEPPLSRSPEPGDRPRNPAAGEGGGTEQWFSVSQVTIADAQMSFEVLGRNIGQPKILVLQNPDRLVFDFPGTTLGPEGAGEEVMVDSPLVKTIRTGQFTPDTVRLVVDLTGSASYQWQYDNERNALQVNVAKPSLAGKIIVIDPGHGSIQPGNWSDPGAIGPAGLYERDVVLDIALKVREELRGRGAEVLLTRQGDTNSSLEDRAYLANKNNADVFVSIHANSSASPSLKGTAVYYYAPWGTAIYNQRQQRTALAQAILNKLTAALGLENLGIREDNFSVLRNTLVPSVLVETAFISNPNEEGLLKDEAFRTKAAKAIAEGITQFLLK